jgi:hypothetical protein
VDLAVTEVRTLPGKQKKKTRARGLLTLSGSEQEGQQLLPLVASKKRRVHEASFYEVAQERTGSVVEIEQQKAAAQLFAPWFESKNRGVH